MKQPVELPWLQRGVVHLGQWLSRLRKPRVLVLTGPTSIGKTALSIDLAKRLNGEIISADSVQVYRSLDIGSGKIGLAEMQGIRHYLIDICDPVEDFSAGRFYKEARAATETVLARGKVAIVVGGTGFYLKWFVHGNAKTGVSTAETRKRAEDALTHAWNLAEAEKGEGLSKEEKWQIGINVLKRAGDPEAAHRILQERNNYYRLTRALEIVLGQNANMAELSVDVQKPLDYDFRCFFLHRPRLEIYDRIERRCEEMVQNGLLEEAEHLLQIGLLPDENCATRSIGYRQAMQFLQKLKKGEMELTDDAVVEFLQAFKSATRKLAKQQITWFRSEPLYHWIDLSSQNADPLDLILQKSAKFAFPGRAEKPPVLSRDEEKALKRYTPKLHFYRDAQHRTALRERIQNILDKAEVQ